MAQGRYQTFQDLRPEEFAALRDDIALRGCFVPVEVDDRGEILDGFHRVQICEELGIQYKKVVRRFDSEKLKVEHSLKMNLLRRHLGPISWARAFKKLCEVRGIRLGKGKQKGKNDTVSHLARELGVIPRTAQRRILLAESLAKYPDLIDAVDAGRLEGKRALRVVRERQFGSRWKRAQKPSKLPATCRIEHCDFRKMKIAAHSVDLIFVDPPYSREYKSIWRDLGKLSKKILRPGHLLVTYTGQVCFPDAFDGLRESLDYVWIGSIDFKAGNYPSYHPLKIQARSCPLLFMSNGKYAPKEWFSDGIEAFGPEKAFHPWQKNLREALYYIERLTKPGETVADFFLGSGTTGVASIQQGRSFIGCDVDAETVKVAAKRIEEEGRKEAKSQ